MYIKENYFVNDEIYDAHVLKTEVNLNDLENNKVSLLLKPLHDEVKIIRRHYNNNDELDYAQELDCFRLSLDYDNKHDRIELSVINGFDKFIYNICVLLNIGRFTLIFNPEEYERHTKHLTTNETYFHTLILSLDEFKQLDGFCGVIDISGISIDFIRLCMPFKSMYELECNDFKRFDERKEYFLRGEKLFKWID